MAFCFGGLGSTGVDEQSGSGRKERKEKEMMKF